MRLSSVRESAGDGLPRNSQKNGSHPSLQGKKPCTTGYPSLPKTLRAVAKPQDMYPTLPYTKLGIVVREPIKNFTRLTC